MTDGGTDLQRPLSEIKAELFKALAHPARIRVLELLAEGERRSARCSRSSGIELSHLSQQLGVLRRAGLVTTRKEGSSVFYAIKDPLVAELLAVGEAPAPRLARETRGLLAGSRRRGRGA